MTRTIPQDRNSKTLELQTVPVQSTAEESSFEWLHIDSAFLYYPNNFLILEETTSKTINRCCFNTFKIRIFIAKFQLNTSLFLRNNVKHRARNRLEMFRDHSERHAQNFIQRLKGS